MQKPGTCNQYEDIVKKLKQAEPVRIVGLGDSLTYGWEASYSYFDLFISKLRADYCGVTITSHNAGICGDTAAGGERRLNDTLLESTDLVIVQFGINDLYSGVPIEEYKSSLCAIARKAIRRNALPLFITSGPLLYPEQQLEISPYYDALKSAAHSYDCPVADIATYWRMHYQEFSSFYYDDGVHPTNSGYRAMANALYAICETL